MRPRRRFAAARRVSSGDALQRELAVQGPDEEIRYLFVRRSGGLYVEKQQTSRRGDSTEQMVHFASLADFDHWCDSEPMRFADPGFFADVRHAGEELWSSQPPPSVASGH